jgi:hypothetical protein
MAGNKRVNYTEEDEKQLKAMYADGTSTAVMADIFGKTPRSIIAKLTQMKVYQAQVKAPAVQKDEGPSKKDLMAALLQVWPDAPIDGLVNARKDTFNELIALATRVRESVAQDQAA